ncbi:MAG: polysaccharide deacetylase family protein [Gaiellales bacterium]
MLQADPILRDTGMKATMFVVGQDAGASSFYYADWGALSGYAASGRWELANETDALHHGHRVDGRFLSDVVRVNPGESISAYQARIGADLDGAEALIDQNSPDHPIAFAYPYGDWGQTAGPRVARALNQVLRARFQLAFDQDGQSGWRPAMPGDDPMHIHRLQAMDWTGAQLLGRLDAAMKLGRTTFEQRGLDVRYTPNQLVRAASAYRCAPGGPVTVSRGGRQKLIALTFDGGPSPYTAQMLDVLSATHDHATFFLTGNRTAGTQRLLVRMVLSGDEIGNGTWGGAWLDRAGPRAVRAAITRAQRAIRAQVPVTPCLTRPPDGLDRTRFARIAAQLHLSTALWSIDPRDHRSTDPRAIARQVVASAFPGAIVVMHDGGGPRWATVQALPLIAERLHKLGYRLVTVSQLMAASGADSAAGR